MADHSGKQYELIDNYLLGNLSGDDLAMFEKRLKEDGEFRKEVELHRKIVQGIIELEEDRIRDIMHKADMEMGKAVIRRIPYLKYAGYAATILILISLGVYLIFFSQTLNEEIFAKYFDPYENDLVISSRSDKLPEVLSGLEPDQAAKIITGMKHYDHGEYEKASVYLDNTFVKEKNEIMFYLALSQLASGQDQAALDNLELLLQYPEFRYSDEVSWYLALALLKAERDDESKSLLVEISESNSPYSRKAQTLLKEII